MSKHFPKLLSLMLVISLLASLVVPAAAATYRPGAQSGPSSSYKGDRYYDNYTRVPITGDGRTDVLAIALSQLGYQEGAANGNFSGEVSGRNNYVEYSYNLGEFGLGYGDSDFPWCASFVSWCLYQSRNTDQNTWRNLGRYHVGDYKYIWKEISCSQWVRQLKGAGYYKYSAYEDGSYTPKYGDLVLLNEVKVGGLMVSLSEPNIAAKQVDETVFVAGVYELDGVTYTTGILAYSLGRYCQKIAADDTSDQQAFSAATAVYGYYAKEYFANL